jgi:hypothetical protein
VAHLPLILAGVRVPRSLFLSGTLIPEPGLLAGAPGQNLGLFLAGGPVQNPAPVDPTNGSNGVTLLLAYAKWGALMACAGAALASGGLMAMGSLSNRPDHADRGKRALLWSLGGVVITAIAIPVINTVIGAVH